MPIYTFKCQLCDKEFVVQKAMGDEDPQDCGELSSYTQDSVKEIDELNVKQVSFCDRKGQLVKVIEKPQSEVKEDMAGKDIEYRIQQHYQEVKEAMEKDKKKRASINLDDIKGNFK